MQRANLFLAIGGDHSQQVPKYGVTASEIAVLQSIHGFDAIRDVEPVEDIDVNARDEIARLRGLYGGAQDGNGNRIVEKVFPGLGARTIDRLEDLQIPHEFYKATGRKNADSKPAKAIEGPKNVAEVDEDGFGDMTRRSIVE